MLSGRYRPGQLEGNLSKTMEGTQKSKTRNRIWILLAGVLFVAAMLLLSGRMPWFLTKKDKVLTIGVFSDSYWEVQNGYSYQILEDAIAKYEKQNPGIRVEYVSGVMKEDYMEWLSEQILQGTAPDIFFLPEENVCEFAQAGVLKKLNHMIEKDTGFSTEQYYTSALQSGVYAADLYALPYECAPRLMFVNKSILDAEHISMPDNDWSFQDLYNICKKVTKDTDGNGVLDQFGITGYTFEDAFYGNDVTLFNQSGTECYFTGDKVEHAIAFLEKLEDTSQGHTVSEKDFDQGKVAFMPMLFSEYRAYKPYPLSVKKYSSFEWECLSMPAGPDGSNVSRLDTLLIAMNRKSKNKQAAFEFMKLLTADEEIQSEIFAYSEGVSVLKKVTESEQTLARLLEDSGNSGFHLDTLSSAVENAVVYPGFDGYDEMIKEVGTAVSDILADDENIGTGQIIWNRKLNALLKEKSKWNIQI